MDAVIVNPAHVADVLEAAADFIDVHGWCQGQPFNDEGAVCISGALYQITADSWRARRVLHNVVGEPIAAWNDAKGREQWEVDQLLRDTAKRVRAGDIAVG